MTEAKKTVTMIYPTDAPGPHGMILTGVGYFEKGKLTEVDDRKVAEYIELRKKGPRIATADEIAAVKHPDAERKTSSADTNSGAPGQVEPADAKEERTEDGVKIDGDKRRPKKGEKQAIG